MTKITSKMLDGRYLAKEAEKAGLRVENGCGDHKIAYAPIGRGYEAIPQRPLGKGLACKIVKWLLAAGVPLGLLVYLICSL